MDEVKFFFSYVREDSEVVIRLAKELRAVGANLWLDQLDILGGQRWDHAVEGALATCQGMIVILSPEAVASQNVMDEVSYALEERKLVVPILLRSCTIPFRLRRVQYIDFTGSYETGFSQLLRALHLDQPFQPLKSAVPEEVVRLKTEGTLPEAENQPPAVQMTQGGAIQARILNLLSRRSFLGLSLVASLGVLTVTIIKFFPSTRKLLFRNPRFVRKPRAKPCIVSLQSGFYLNPASNIVHYVLPSRVIRGVRSINESSLERWQVESFNGGKAHLQLASASSSFEDAASKFISEGKPLRAIELLHAAISHDVMFQQRSGKRPNFRLYDLYAGLSLRHGKPENILDVVGLISKSDQAKYFTESIAKWKSEKGRWYRSWADNKNVKQWAGLPM